MRRKVYYFLSMLLIGMLQFCGNALAQYPGGVSTGTVRGYKCDLFYNNGTAFNSPNQFGTGATVAPAMTVPTATGYSNKVTGSEYYNKYATNYAMQYTGTLEVPATGTYTFSLSSDDWGGLYIDGTLILSANAGSGTVNTTYTFSAAGDHAIMVKYYQVGGSVSAGLQFTGPGISSATDVDGRFVRYDGVKLSGWYNAANLNVTANYGGAGTDKVNSWTNIAPDYPGNGNLQYGGSGYAVSGSATQLVNYNPSVTFDGDDWFSAAFPQNGLSYRGATKSMFTVADYNATGVALTNSWMFVHGNVSANGQAIGYWKTGNNVSAITVAGTGSSNSSLYTAFEPKVLGGFVDQALGASAPATTNPLTLNANGGGGTPTQLNTNPIVPSGGSGLQLGISYAGNLPNGAYMTEQIYYPFKLSTVQEQQVNTYLAIKYGVSLTHDYLNTSGATVFGLTANTGYTNRIFGIGRELAAEGLNQKQSQSQMTAAAGYDFLVLSKGAIAATNAANTGTLNNGDYVILGDNNGALAAQHWSWTKKEAFVS